MTIEHLRLLTADQLEEIALDDTLVFWRPVSRMYFRDAERAIWTVSNYAIDLIQLPSNRSLRIVFCGLGMNAYDVSISATASGGFRDYLPTSRVSALRRLATLLKCDVTTFTVSGGLNLVTSVVLHGLPRDATIASNVYLAVRTSVLEELFPLLAGVEMAKAVVAEDGEP